MKFLKILSLEKGEYISCLMLIKLLTKILLSDIDSIFSVPY